MKALWHSPLFGILLSVLAFEIGLFINRRTKLAVLNAYLISVLLIIGVLLHFRISLASFNVGGQFISLFLGPATVVLAVPLYRQLPLLRANIVPIMAGVGAGSVTAVASALVFAKWFGLDPAVGISLVPKSVTTPIGIEVAKELGGITPITVAAIIVSGIAGAVIGPALCRCCGIRDKVAVGIAIGTASHAIGTTKALELGETEGAMSGLAIGIAGLVIVLLAPLLVRLI
ncbi:putative murein hydrolase (TIGR00659 family) [Hydrogenispora ethanolica]|jgi:predicted murein hydrolase (TIGR00659 family)|uniref:Putative murein hydrolase (TIGR00659 family) n=1 Tax=Hydrogenispora ethanolica TaxID=1082276 RepID=A0A4V2QGQ7_HYDET|nr:LrgB family protein [Hydrogenispora ethanolica]TCL76777.1 putative murein hydrolase (TIGR00659 family) [Hydrogenispora ethanolica]